MGRKGVGSTNRRHTLAAAQTSPPGIESRQGHNGGGVERGGISFGEMAAIQEISRIVTSALDIDQLYERFTAEAKKLMDFDRLVISEIDQEAEIITATYRSGVEWEGYMVGQVLVLEGSKAQWMEQTGRPVLREDIRTGDRFRADWARLQAGFRSDLSVPLWRRGRVVGGLNVLSFQIGAYGLREQAILERLADQISPAVENARIHEELQTSTEQKAVVDEVARIITSTLNIGQVYDKFATEVKKLLDFDKVAISRIDLDAGTFTPRYVSGVPWVNRSINAAVPLRGTTIEHVLRTGRTLLRADISTGKRFLGDPARLRAGLRSSLLAPLRNKGQITGALHVHSCKVGTYGLKDQATLEHLADQIAPAVENAQAYHDLGERIKELNCLYRISGLAQMHDMSLEEFLQKVCDLLPSAWLYPECACSRVLMGDREFRTEDFEETRWKQTAGIFVDGERCGMVQVCYLEERPESAEGPFLAEERNLIDGIAEQLGQVAERKKAQEVARFVSRKLLHVQEEERRSIARELHDEIGQQLTGLKLTIDALASRTSERQEQTAVLLQHILSDLINSARNLSTGLRPPMLEEFGLRAALDWLFDRVERQSNVCVKSDYTGLDRRFQPEVEIVVFRVVQESLNNVARHAQVDEADVQIDYYGQVLAIEIGDKGAGFDARAALASPATVGLVGMEERVTLLGGRFAVDSARGKGTRVRVRLPVQDQ